MIQIIYDNQQRMLKNQIIMMETLQLLVDTQTELLKQQNKKFKEILKR